MDETNTKSMFDRSFGHFVRILVDLDLTGTIRNIILVERKSFAFFVEVTYENIHDFCDHCKFIGHNVGSCRKLSKNLDSIINKSNAQSKKKNLCGKI